MANRPTGFVKRTLALAGLILFVGLHQRNRGSSTDAGHLPDTEMGGRSRPHANSDAPVGQQQQDLHATATGSDARPSTSSGTTRSTYVGDGPVEFKPPARGFTEAERRQAEEYVNGGNEAINEGTISPTGRVSTTNNPQLERDARNRARQERRAAENDPDRDNYKGVTAHLPDTGWMDPKTRGVPVAWGDHTLELNSSLASQSKDYPVGFKPTEFRLAPEWYTQNPLPDS